MKITTIAITTAFALTAAMGYAQAGNETGTTTHHKHSGVKMNRAPGTTTGMSRSGASGPRLEPGGRDESRPGGKGVNDRPGD